MIMFNHADNTTIYFLKDMLTRKKRYVHVDDVKNLHVPQFRYLTLEKILDFVREKPRIN